MRAAGAFEAKNKFGTLLNWVESGQEVVIARCSGVVAQLETCAPHVVRFALN